MEKINARIVVSPTGQIRIITDEGSLETGTEKIQAILDLLSAAGLQPDEIGKVEQHRHGPGFEHQHIHH